MVAGKTKSGHMDTETKTILNSVEIKTQAYGSQNQHPTYPVNHYESVRSYSNSIRQISFQKDR